MKLVEIALREDAAPSTPGNTRVHNADIPTTIKYFSTISGIPVRDLHKVGTTGKTPSSGDIDLALDASKYDMDIIHNKIKGELGAGNVNKNTKVASYIVPIRGKEDKGTVRIDLMYGGKPEWMKFAYHSEGDGSRYKGAIRSILLQSVAASMDKKGTDHMEFDGNQLTIRAGRMVDLSTGLKRSFQYKNKKKDGTGYDDKFTSVSVDDFKKKFPNIEVKGGEVIVDDPAEFVKILFGSATKPAHVNTAEEIIALIKKKFDGDTQDKIFRIARMRAKNIAHQMRLPRELESEDDK